MMIKTREQKIREIKQGIKRTQSDMEVLGKRIIKKKKELEKKKKLLQDSFY